MKITKQIAIIFFTVILFNCQKEEITKSFIIEYDTQDNVVKYAKNWVQSWNFKTNQPNNNFFGVKHLYHNNQIIIKSNNYKMINFQPINFVKAMYKVEFLNQNKTIKVTFNNLKKQINNNEVLKFKITVI